MSGMSGDCGQVAAISSTDTSTPETLSGLADVFKPPSDIGLGSPTHMGGGGQMGMGANSMPADTQVRFVLALLISKEGVSTFFYG